MNEQRLTREQMISLVITSKYSIDDQIALLRQRDTKPEEWEEFNTFAEEVKQKVTEEYQAIEQETLKNAYENAKRYYPDTWSADYLKTLVDEGFLTIREYESIVGK